MTELTSILMYLAVYCNMVCASDCVALVFGTVAKNGTLVQRLFLWLAREEPLWCQVFTVLHYCDWQKQREVDCRKQNVAVPHCRHWPAGSPAENKRQKKKNLWKTLQCSSCSLISPSRIEQHCVGESEVEGTDKQVILVDFTMILYMTP